MVCDPARATATADGLELPVMIHTQFQGSVFNGTIRLFGHAGDQPYKRVITVYAALPVPMAESQVAPVQDSKPPQTGP